MSANHRREQCGLPCGIWVIGFIANCLGTACPSFHPILFSLPLFSVYLSLCTVPLFSFPLSTVTPSLSIPCYPPSSHIYIYAFSRRLFLLVSVVTCVSLSLSLFLSPSFRLLMSANWCSAGDTCLIYPPHHHSPSPSPLQLQLMVREGGRKREGGGSCWSSQTAWPGWAVMAYQWSLDWPIWHTRNPLVNMWMGSVSVLSLYVELYTISTCLLFISTYYLLWRQSFP